MIGYLRQFLYVLAESKKSLLTLLLMFTFTSVLEALGVGLISPFLSLAYNPESIHKITLLDWTYKKLALQSSSQFIFFLSLLIATIFCIKSILYFLSRSYIYQFSYHQKEKLISRLLKSYLTVPYTFHLSRNTASLIKNTIVETDQFTQLCMLPFLTAIANFLVIFVLLLILAWINLFLLMFILVIILLVFLCFNLLRRKLKRWGYIRSESYQEMIRIINHSLGGLKETKILGCESYFENQIAHTGQEFAKVSTLFASFQLAPRIVIETIFIIFLMLFISICQIFFKQNIQDLTSVMGVFAVASIRLIPSASQSLQAIGHMQNGSHALEMLYLDLKEIEKQNLDRSFDIASRARANQPISFKHLNERIMTFVNQVDLINITYRYPGISEAAIENISLTIKKGQSIGIIGKSGAGKTTLIDVILGLLDPESGDIRVDDVSVYENLRFWQNLIGYIPQSIFLIDDTVERNIAFGIPDDKIDAERLHKAIEAAQLVELVEGLPNGIKTQVGERGIRLSGGQRQRVGIARALYHQREILVLDEATAALDRETENLVSQAIKSLAGIKTLIIIAHRLSTIEHCDRVYWLDKGRIVKSGSYKEVVLEGGNN
jgi:ATP-binding cassette, subfamily B, bacterial PglK